MKKQNIVDLVKYHVEKKETAFVSTVADIAREFENIGDYQIAAYLMELVSTATFYVPQANYNSLRFLKKIEYSNNPLLLPNIIEEDIIGITRSISKNMGLSKFLFYGSSGTGKTESAYQIARILGRDILSVSFEQLFDSRLGETAKNISILFEEINHLPYDNVLVLLDEIDSLVMDRINKNDLREVGRVTSTFLRGMDCLNNNILLIATTNLFNNFDKALLRRFDSLISFDRYSKEDLIEIATVLLSLNLKMNVNYKKDIRLFKKILMNIEKIPLPGDLKQIFKTSIAFSDDSNEYDYLRKLYLSLNDNPKVVDIQKLKKEGFTTREIEIITRIPRSSVSRKLRNK